MGKHSANVTTTEISIDNVPFMVKSFVWGEGDNQFTEYHVYEVSRMFGKHSSISFEGDIVWGDVTSYFEDDLFAHLPYGSKERIIQVRSYIAFRKALAREIVYIGLGIQNAKVV